MKILLLSILSVVMIGSTIPSVFALDDNGDFYLVYDETKNYKDYEDWVKTWEYDDSTEMGYFEYQIEWLNYFFKLPYDIPIFVAECEEPNAWYYYEDVPPYSEIVICYELIDEIAYYKSQQYEDADLITESTINVVDFILYHELGHAFIHLYDLPITGAEEDVADQFASYILLTTGQEGQDVSMYMIDAADYWLDLSNDYEISKEHYAGVHSLDIQRFHDLACYVYGSNSPYNSDLVELDWILDDRIDYCYDEYNQIIKSWDILLEDFLKFEQTSSSTTYEDDSTFIPTTKLDKENEMQTLIPIVENAMGSSFGGCEPDCFIPATVTIDVGGMVTFANNDSAAHTSTAGTPADGPSGVWDSSLVMTGQLYTTPALDAGEYPYFCMVHPWMEGLVIVEAEGSHYVHDYMEMQTLTAADILIDLADDAKAGERVAIDVTISGSHVNYDIVATQNGEIILDESGSHSHTGEGYHVTSALSVDVSDDSPIDVTVTFQGFGMPGDEMTGPVGLTSTARVVPEFGTIAALILVVAIGSIIAISAKSRLSFMPRL